MAEVTKKRRLSADGAYVSSQTADSAQIRPTNDNEDNQKGQRRSLFVRSLPTTVTTEKLAEYFSQSYPIKHATVVQDSATKESKGYGFVTFADPEDAHQAISEFNGSIFDSHKIKVELAQPRHRDVFGEGGRSVPAEKALEENVERQKKKTEAQPPKLIIRNLPWSIKEPDDLAKLFISYGKVKSAVIPKKGPNMQAGFGFVVLRGRKNAERALEGVNGKEVDGRTLAVDWAVDKETWQTLQQQQSTEDIVDERSSHVKPRSDDGADSDVEIEEQDKSLAGESDIEDSTDGADGRSFGDHDYDEVLDSTNDDVEDEPPSTDADKETIGDDTSKTIFIRNLPYSTDDDLLYEHFTSFGPVRYARAVYDLETERPRGTGFVCFYNEEDAKDCIKNAPRPVGQTGSDHKYSHSILQNEASDPTGRYTIDGRILNITRALPKSTANRKEAEGKDRRNARDRDKRRLYLLSEGTIPSNSPLYKQLGPTELNMRAASAKQRQNLIKTNPSLHLSLTRLSIRNIPRSITSKDLKSLAREAVVGFASDVKQGLRQPLSKEETSRGGEEMRQSERIRKEKGKGMVKQAKIVFESRDASGGHKVPERSGVGRSRGYGFIEYYSHRNALMGLRWLNGHSVKSGSGSASTSRNEEKEEKKKRLIVEFAIENAQVVKRRKEAEDKTRQNGPRSGPKPKRNQHDKGHEHQEASTASPPKKRKRSSSSSTSTAVSTNEKKSKKYTGTPARDNDGDNEAQGGPNQDTKNKLAKRNRIIAKKRMMRRSRKG